MKHSTTLAALLVLFGGSFAQAMAVTANLVGQRVGTSVGGQSIRICIYQYNGQRFEKALPISESCPFSIQLQ